MPETAVVHAVTLPGVAWFKSSYSGSDQSTCVEVADVRPSLGRIAVRDSKNPEGPALLFAPDQFAAFVTGACVRADEIS
ncbi:DUF397 domain-containing protein [Streptomyces bluensis]|uniref:DUF397 domain-containing protein n=1 Tax=Streptomyces bluensis TaxID=33897 RepID=UPI0016731485|nr:DUF397 domain-containing protein [Streptomyces bluensis]GGZ90828.1 hypothetical protein GCM10010344_68180 [Streptomyces bluensis]